MTPKEKWITKYLQQLGNSPEGYSEAITPLAIKMASDTWEEATRQEKARCVRVVKRASVYGYFARERILECIKLG